MNLGMRIILENVCVEYLECRYSLQQFDSILKCIYSVRKYGGRGDKPNVSVRKKRRKGGGRPQAVSKHHIAFKVMTVPQPRPPHWVVNRKSRIPRNPSSPWWTVEYWWILEEGRSLCSLVFPGVSPQAPQDNHQPTFTQMALVKLRWKSKHVCRKGTCRVMTGMGGR